MNYEYRVLVNDSAFKIDESYEIEREDNESDEDYEKRAFQVFQEYRNLDEWEWFELRQYDFDNDDYLDWDMTESKYYNGGSE